MSRSVKKKQSNISQQNNEENPMNATATAPKRAESKEEPQKVNTKPQAVAAPQKPQSAAAKPEEKEEQPNANVVAPVAPTALVAAEKPQEVKEEVLNLSQVASLTGRSYAGVNASAEKLAAAGANTSGKGKEWAVTRSHLVKVGWLDGQGNPVAPQRGRGAAKPRLAEAITPSPLSIPELVLAAEVAEQVASEKKQEATEATAAARAARRAVDEAVQNAEVAFKQAEANLAAARSLMSK